MLRWGGRGGGGPKSTTGFDKIIVHFIEALSICAVNCFVMISGYFLVNSYNRNIKKIIGLFLQVIIYGIIMYSAGVILNVVDFKWISFLAEFVPQNYYVTLYCVLLICSVFYNVLIYNINKEWLNKLIVILICLFALWPTLADILQDLLGRSLIGISPISAFGNNEGYTLIQFSLMYFLGAYVRINKEKFQNKNYKFMFIYIFSALIIWIMSFKFQSAWNYCNLFVVIESFALFIVFMNLKIQNKGINYVAKHVFGVYILHTSAIMLEGLWGMMNIRQHIVQGGMSFLANMVISVTLMCLFCIVLDIVLQKIMYPFNAVLDRIHIANIRYDIFKSRTKE